MAKFLSKGRHAYEYAVGICLWSHQAINLCLPLFDEVLGAVSEDDPLKMTSVSYSYINFCFYLFIYLFIVIYYQMPSGYTVFLIVKK